MQLAGVSMLLTRSGVRISPPAIGCGTVSPFLSHPFPARSRWWEGVRKVAWDLAGDAFGTRQLQYERYYVGDPVRILARTFLAYDRTECQKLVDYALALAGDPEGST